MDEITTNGSPSAVKSALAIPEKIPATNNSKQPSSTIILTTGKPSTVSIPPSARPMPSTSSSTNTLSTLATTGTSTKKKSASPAAPSRPSTADSKKKEVLEKIVSAPVEPISMVGVTEIGVEDVAVLRLRGHTVPVSIISSYL